MKNERKLKYNFLHIIFFTILNFINVSYFVVLKFVIFFVIMSVQQGRRKPFRQGGQNKKKVLQSCFCKVAIFYCTYFTAKI